MQKLPDRELEMHRSVLRNVVYKAKVVREQLRACRWVSVVLRLHGNHPKHPCCILGLETSLDGRRQLEFRLALQVPGIPAHKLPPPKFVNLAACPSESSVVDAIAASQYLTLGPLYRGLFSYSSFAKVVSTFYLRGMKVTLDENLAPAVEWTGACNPIHSFVHQMDKILIR